METLIQTLRRGSPVVLTYNGNEHIQQVVFVDNSHNVPRLTFDRIDWLDNYQDDERISGIHTCDYCTIFFNGGYYLNNNVIQFNSYDVLLNEQADDSLSILVYKQLKSQSIHLDFNFNIHYLNNQYNINIITDQITMNIICAIKPSIVFDECERFSSNIRRFTRLLYPSDINLIKIYNTDIKRIRFFPDYTSPLNIINKRIAGRIDFQNTLQRIIDLNDIEKDLLEKAILTTSSYVYPFTVEETLVYCIIIEDFLNYLAPDYQWPRPQVNLRRQWARMAYESLLEIEPDFEEQREIIMQRLNDDVLRTSNYSKIQHLCDTRNLNVSEAEVLLMKKVRSNLAHEMHYGDVPINAPNHVHTRQYWCEVAKSLLNKLIMLMLEIRTETWDYSVNPATGVRWWF